MCLGHKWETILERMVKATYAYDPMFPEYQEHVLLTFQRCYRCNKERAFITHANGKSEKRDPAKIKYDAAMAALKT